LLDAQNISCVIAGREILASVSLGVYGGEIACIVGENGAGKSLLLRILAGERMPSAGTVWAEATDAPVLLTGPGHMSPSRFLTTQEYCQHLAGAAAAPVVEEALVSRGLIPSRPVGLLSYGEHQRLSLLVALLSSASVILLDSPTLGLDSGGFDFLEEVLLQLADEGRAVLVATTTPEFVIRFGDCALYSLAGGVLRIVRPAAIGLQGVLDGGSP